MLPLPVFIRLSYRRWTWRMHRRCWIWPSSTRTISTPSYHQVVQPLYTRSIGRWRNYLPELEPILPVLAPYVSAFGYDPL